VSKGCKLIFVSSDAIYFNYVRMQTLGYILADCILIIAHEDLILTTAESNWLCFASN
jgi:hypothetical protein